MAPYKTLNNIIREASCIFLMGGHAIQQMQLIRDKDIYEDIYYSHAAILGVSAGSINMGIRSLDIWESPIPYDGIGLADITIKAHISPETSEVLQTLLQISVEHDLPICAMEDDSAIFVTKDNISFTGKIHWITNGKIYPFSGNLLKQTTGK